MALRRPLSFLAFAVACATSIGYASVARAAPLSAGDMRGVPVTVDPETLFHTLAADFFAQPDGTVYVQTGDIPAMWLRDSAAQTLPYVRLAKERPGLATWIRGVIAREARAITIDPYANAFRADYRVWERKWEVDSLAYPVLLAWTFRNETGDRRLFTPDLHLALGRVVTTYECERRHDRCSHYRYRARGIDERRGPAPETGLIWSAFRASDDATRYGYNIPEQMLAASALRDLADLAVDGYGDRALAMRAAALAGGIDTGIARYGVFYAFPCRGTVYAYEVDGAGHRLVIDDANLPSLLGAPLAGYAALDPGLYRRTRACVLSKRNRYFYSGRFAAGVGSPHTPNGYVWPLALIARALTTSDRAEILTQLTSLAASAGDGGLIHESFDRTTPSDSRVPSSGGRTRCTRNCSFARRRTTRLKRPATLRWR
jgi:hypothetical protein